MTTLTVQRPRRRIGRTTPAPGSTRTLPAPDLIAWSTDGNGMWHGRIDLLDAGTITRTAAGYAVTSWDGEADGVFPTLAAAQRSLEPTHRARLRDEAEARRRRGRRAAGAAAGAVALAATAATGLLITLPL